MARLEERAAHVVQGHPGLARSPVMRRLYELAEKRGIAVWWVPRLPGAERWVAACSRRRINGAYYRQSTDGPAVIVLNPRMRGRLRSFVFSHELAHHVLAPATSSQAFESREAELQALRDEERKADAFARRLLYHVRRGIECKEVASSG